MRIIIVDDDPLVCQSLKTIIEVGSERGAGEKVEVAAMGKTAKKLLIFTKKKNRILCFWIFEWIKWTV